ncbi:hypothetical protein MO867_20740 [Microbulbifer sp. OS29]|uniref:Integrase core domain-containing protein n=1 Tax=Microbulbifer okhotskensis TaxID=2926617 RepID=A0A9X2EVL0_9GAMM|nr:hypothetical protein [Microbulbifer okhotskensis]
MESARKWVHRFVQWYNNHHRHSAVRYVIPSQRHSGAESPLLKHLHAVYKEAKRRNLQRWTVHTRNWDQISEVWLNPPPKNQLASEIK